MEYEDSDWMPAFNLTLSVAGMYELLFNWFVDTDSSSLVGVVYHGHEQAQTSGHGTNGSGGDPFTIVRRVEDGYVPTGLQVDDRRELYFNSSETMVMDEDASAPLTGTFINRFFCLNGCLFMTAFCLQYPVLVFINYLKIFCNILCTPQVHPRVNLPLPSTT